MGEQGGLNLYGFLGNDSVRCVDRLGQDYGGPGYGQIQTPGGNWPTSGGVTVTLDSAADMLLYFYIGDPNANYTISQRLIDETKKNMDSERSKIKIDVRKEMEYCKADKFNKDYYNPRFVLPDDLNTGGWQLNLSADCNWQCGKGSGSSHSCSMDCRIKAVISKRWTFDPVGYNPDNNNWKIQLTFNLLNHIIHGGGNGSYNISAQFSDSFSDNDLAPWPK